MTAHNNVINSLEFARKSHAIHDTIAATQLTRLKERLASDAGSLDWSLVGEVLLGGGLALNFELKGMLTVPCQRCLESIELDLNVKSKFILVKDESEIPLEDEEIDDNDYLVASAEFDVMQLVEDEILLAIPYATMHDIKDCPAKDRLSELKAPHPFASLKDFKAVKN
jgi:uncharacterized protein